MSKPKLTAAMRTFLKRMDECVVFLHAHKGMWCWGDNGKPFTDEEETAFFSSTVKNLTRDDERHGVVHISIAGRRALKEGG